MEILNIGPQELIFIIALMIVLLGPHGMKRLAWQTGTWIRKARHSPLWKEIARLNREARDLPVRIVREAGFDEQMREIQRETQISVQFPSPATRAPGEVRSPGKGKLHPPQERTKGAVSPRTQQVEQNVPNASQIPAPSIAPEPGAQLTANSSLSDEQTGE